MCVYYADIHQCIDRQIFIQIHADILFGFMLFGKLFVSDIAAYTHYVCVMFNIEHIIVV